MKDKTLVFQEVEDNKILAKSVVKLWYESILDDSEKAELSEAVERAGYHLSEDGLYDIFDEEENLDDDYSDSK